MSPARFLLLALAGALLLTGCAGARLPEAEPPVPPMPEVQREFRGAWIATVANIDWPSRPGLSTAEQQAELLSLLDRAAQLNLNAVVLQIRPMADAFYDSPHEPWSAYLTGEQGRAPEPFDDPLAFAVEEAHRRGLELHAWINPFRAVHSTAREPLAENHVSRTRPELVHRYDELLWMDPGAPAAVEHSLRVILDVVRRYDVDAVHLDDYFYPYPVTDAAGRRVEFPDSLSWRRALAEGATGSRDDWRRRNVDRFVERLYHAVKAEKPWVKVGISPFGIWRPGHPEPVRGLDAYAELYADARKWQQSGWVDYLAPQLYWRIASEGQPYPLLLQWWHEQNAAGRHLWPGLYASRVGFEGDAAWEPQEIVEQVRLTRTHPGAGGNVLFSMKWLREEASPLGQALAAAVYGEPALVPASPWLGEERPGRPLVTVRRSGDEAAVSMTPGIGAPVWLWVVRIRHGAEWTVEVVPGGQRAYALPVAPDGGLPDEVVVSAVSRLGHEGPTATVTSRSVMDGATSRRRRPPPAGGEGRTARGGR